MSYIINSRFAFLLKELNQKRDVDVEHIRRKDTVGNLLPTGGQTKVILRTPDYGMIETIVECSKKERYNKRIGLKIALGRALKIWYMFKLQNNTINPYSTSTKYVYIPPYYE